jgi:hypothetical protein
MEKPYVLGMDGVGPMTLIDGKEEINKVTLVTLGVELESSAILDEKFMLDIM